MPPSGQSLRDWHVFSTTTSFLSSCYPCRGSLILRYLLLRVFNLTPAADCRFSLPNMSASKPSPTIDTAQEDWDALLIPSSSSTQSASSPPLLVPSSSSSSGEFNSFSFVGAVLSGGVAGAGGPAAGSSVFRLLKDDCRCLGSITGGKFCLKMCDGEQACNVPTHATRKAKLQFDHFYIRENDAKAYCDPKLSLSLLTTDQISYLQDLQLPKDQWLELFKAIDNGDGSNWFPSGIASIANREPANRRFLSLSYLRLQLPHRRPVYSASFRRCPTRMRMLVILKLPQRLATHLIVKPCQR